MYYLTRSCNDVYNDAREFPSRMREKSIHGCKDNFTNMQEKFLHRLNEKIIPIRMQEKFLQGYKNDSYKDARKLLHRCKDDS